MKKHLLLLASLGFLSLQAQVIISDDETLGSTTTTNPNAVLDIRSNSKGLLFPRLTSAQIDVLDGDQSATSLSPGMTVYNTETKKFLGWDGEKWQDLGYEGASALTSPTIENQIIITEIMINPNVVEEKAGEWFELYNTTTEDLNLRGCTVSKANQNYSFDINGDLVVPGQSYIGIGSNLDTASNSGATIDYSYGFGPSNSNFPLDNTADDISLTCNATQIDQVSYDNTFFDGNNAPIGSSIYLNPNAFNATDNDLGSNWLVSTTPYGNGDNNGTPSNENQTPPATQSVLGFSTTSLTVEEDDLASTTIQLSPASTDVASVDVNINSDNNLGTLGTDYDIDYNGNSITSFPFTVNFASNAGSEEIIFTYYGDTDTVSETAILSLENATGTNVEIGTNSMLDVLFNDSDAPSVIGQNFDDITTWNFTPESNGTFNANGALLVPSNPNRFYGILEKNTNTLLENSPNMSGYIFGFQDLQGSGYGIPSLQYTTYTSDIATISNQSTLSFDYNMVGFDSSDVFTYKVIFDSNDLGSYVTLPKNASGNEEINIPAGTTTVQLIFRYKQNGGSDAAAIDNIILQ